MDSLFIKSLHVILSWRLHENCVFCHWIMPDTALLISTCGNVESPWLTMDLWFLVFLHHKRTLVLRNSQRATSVAYHAEESCHRTVVVQSSSAGKCYCRSLQVEVHRRSLGVAKNQPFYRVRCPCHRCESQTQNTIHHPSTQLSPYFIEGKHH